MSLTGPRREWEQSRGLRAYRCRHCQHAQDDYYMPVGWMQVRIRDPQADPDGHTYRIVGLYCTPGCLAAEAASWPAGGLPDAEASGGGR
jgi:hypothetical protein